MTTYPKPRLISLFAGVGGFDLGFEAAGFTTVGQCEIDEHATMVLERHWPTVPKHPDVTTLKPEHFGPAEVVTFGSPCQDLSVAGKRAGLAGERSGLFTAAMDYIRAMQEATHGEYPRVVVWENVPGAFSSNDGHDFAAVLESMVGGSPRPTPPDGGWPSAGVAFGPQGAVEWRVFDSQYFGVAQRRRRIFVIYHPGGIRAGQVLLEPQGMPRDPSESNETRPHATSPAAGSARDGGREDRGVDRNSERVTALTSGLGSGGPDAAHAQAGWLVPVPALAKTITTREGARLDPEFETLLPVLNDQGGARIDISHGVTGTLRATSKGNEPIIPAPPVAFKIRGGVEVDSNGKGAGKGYLGSENKALTLGASQDQYLAEPIAFDPGAGQHGTNESTDLAPTLKASCRGRVAAAIPTPAIGFDHAAGAAHGMSEREETAPTLQASAGIGRAAVAYPLQMSHSQSLGIGIGADADPSYTLDTGGKNAVAAVAFAMRGRDGGNTPEVSGDKTSALRGATGGSTRDMIATTYAVRRLTPRECERLQAFPDDHTRYAPDGTEIADTHRYRMCGNAVTTTVAAWIARRIMHELHQTGTPAPHGVT